MTRKVSNKLKPWLMESGLLRIQGWCRDGLTNEDIAKNIGINPKTLYDWINKYPEIAEVMALGKEPADRKVENSLNDRANGFTKVVNTTKVLKDGSIVKYQEEIYYPPDTTAAIFWLKNRKPDEWRDRQEVNHSGSIEQGNEILLGIMDQLKSTPNKDDG